MPLNASCIASFLVRARARMWLIDTWQIQLLVFEFRAVGRIRFETVYRLVMMRRCGVETITVTVYRFDSRATNSRSMICTEKPSDAVSLAGTIRPHLRLMSPAWNRGSQRIAVTEELTLKMMKTQKRRTRYFKRGKFM